MEILKWVARKTQLSTLFESIEKSLTQWNAPSREVQLNTMKAHLRYLGAMCYIHTMWANQAMDAETIRQHHEIIHTLQQFQKQLTLFLDTRETLVK